VTDLDPISVVVRRARVVQQEADAAIGAGLNPANPVHEAVAVTLPKLIRVLTVVLTATDEPGRVSGEALRETMNQVVAEHDPLAARAVMRSGAQPQPPAELLAVLATTQPTGNPGVQATIWEVPCDSCDGTGIVPIETSDVSGRTRCPFCQGACTIPSPAGEALLALLDRHLSYRPGQ
jgi:hypothetical protein